MSMSGSMFGQEIDAAIMAYANDNAHEEICGVVRKGSGGHFFQPLPNQAVDRTLCFEMSEKAVFAGDNACAIVHSHPQGPAFPSQHDMVQQQASQLPWAIAIPKGHPHSGVFWFGGDPPPLMTRGYRHGVTDCFSLIRDWFAIKRHINLPDYPRAWEWWVGGDDTSKRKDGDLYRDNFAAHGFRVLDDDTPREIGDVAMMRILGSVINHAAIWVGQGLILHHLAGRDGYAPHKLPREEPAERWYRYIDFWVRYDA